MPSLDEQISFPSGEVIGRIKGLTQVNATPTQFIRQSADQIAAFVVGDLAGQMTIDVSKAPEAERQPIREAAQIIGNNGSITILGDSEEGVDVEFSEEDQILRDIVKEIINDPRDVGVKAFRRFIADMFTTADNIQLVVDEWDKYIVGHADTGKITSPHDAHHNPNVGLKKASEGADELREKRDAFLREIMNTVRDKVDAMFDNGLMDNHPSESMMTPDNRLFAIGNAEFSNFVRGAAYYRYRKGDASLDGYEPRRKAADAIDAEIEARKAT